MDVLTIHQAKGLEWPVVFVPCLEASRFPSRYTGQPQEWLIPDSLLPAEARQRYEGTETDERRLFYVAMTRARDMLYLSWFRRKKNRFRPSPFLVDAAGEVPGEFATLPLPPPFVPGEEEEAEKPAFAFSDIAVYENCPLAYRLGALLGFQPQLVAELGYGKAIHHLLRQIAETVRDSGKLPSQDELAGLFAGEFYLPYAHQAVYERLREAAENLVGRYLRDYSEDLFRTWQTERPFELHLDRGVISGRADVILDGEGGESGSLALVDYKTATDPKSDDVYAFQLAIYAAAGLGEGLKVRAAYVHDLAAGKRDSVSVSQGEIRAARERANGLVQGITGRRFDAKPEKSRCSQCDVRFLCQHGRGR